MENKIFN